MAQSKKSVEAKEEIPGVVSVEDLPSGEEKAVSPEMWDPKWTSYVMGHFEPDELYDGCPNRDGLARVAQKLLGPITRSEARTIQPPTAQNGFVSTVEHTVVIGDLCRTEVADVNGFNTTSDFFHHASATGSTRAEARALRKLLGLKRVYAVEEMESSGAARPGFINDGQIYIIRLLCQRNNVNAAKLIKSEYTGPLNDMPAEKAITLIRRLNEYQTGSKSIPRDLTGFDKKWNPIPEEKE